MSCSLSLGDINNVNSFTVNATDFPQKEQIDLKALSVFEASIQSLSVEELYAKNQIIAHSINPYSFTEIVNFETPKVSYGFLTGISGEVFGELFSTGLNQLSSTLLVAGKRVATYRQDGLLFNANLAKPSTITKGDGNTCTTNTGDAAVKSTFSTLDELVEYVLKDEVDRPLMNEVKGFFPSQSLVGLYFRKNSNQKEEAQSYLKMLLVQKKIKDNHNVDIPVFRYDEKGSIERVNTTTQSKFQAYLQVKTAHGSDGKTIANVVARTLGDRQPF